VNHGPALGEQPTDAARAQVSQHRSQLDIPFGADKLDTAQAIEPRSELIRNLAGQPEDQPAMVGNPLDRLAQLGPSVAPLAAEHITGEAFTVKPASGGPGSPGRPSSKAACCFASARPVKLTTVAMVE
jgi:hypothetical protein